MLVHAYATSPGKSEWSGPHQQRLEKNEFKFHSVTWYTNSIVSPIHVNCRKITEYCVAKNSRMSNATLHEAQVYLMHVSLFVPIQNSDHHH